MAENRLLRALSAGDRERLEPFLERVDLARGAVLETIGKRTDRAFFLEAGLAAVVARSPGRRIGFGVVGSDGMTGLEIVQGADLAANEIVVQESVSALGIQREDLREALESSATLRRMLLRYAHAFMIQASQTALTNGRAGMEERLARWILMSADRCTGDDLRVTHQFISLMLGVRRSGITDAMHVLEGKHLVKSTRAHVHVVDRAGLIALAAGSYGVCEEAYERLIGQSFRIAA